MEAAGEEEADGGIPLIGKSGAQFQNMLDRAGFKREDFRIANVLWCRPPNNHLLNQTYTADVLAHCHPYLEAEIERMRPRCILACGAVAARRVLPDIGVGIDDLRGYTHVYKFHDGTPTWVVGTVHPSRILRGQTSLTSVFIHDLTKAVEIARDGFSYLDTGFYSLDPTPAEALEWVGDFERAVSLGGVSHLSCDIETPDKDAAEDELEDPEEEETRDRSYTILRCGYSYHEGGVDGEAHVLSIPRGGPYTQIHRRLLAAGVDKLWWNKSFDVPRVVADGCALGGVQHDGMESWHVLNSDLRRSLGHVSSFLNPRLRMWKHLNLAQPAFYNAQDAYAADVNHLTTCRDLKKHGLWQVYEDQILALDPIWTAMSAAGMPIDAEKRFGFAVELTALQKDCRAQMQKVVPDGCRNLEPKQGYIRPPDLDAIRKTLGESEELVEHLFDAQEVTRCSRCQIIDPKKAHFRVLKRTPLPCGGAEKVTRIEGVSRWVRRQPFVPSPKQILAYQKLVKHSPIMDGRGDQRRPTTSAKAMSKLRAKYHSDPLYPLIQDDRKITKLGGNYIGWVVDGKLTGGFPVGKDQRVHTQITNAAKTLRTTSRSPNLQNMIR